MGRLWNRALISSKMNNLIPKLFDTELAILSKSIRAQLKYHQNYIRGDGTETEIRMFLNNLKAELADMKRKKIMSEPSNIKHK